MASSRPSVSIQGSAKWSTPDKARQKLQDTPLDALAVYQKAARALAVYNGRDASRRMAYKLRQHGLVVSATTQPAPSLAHHIINGINSAQMKCGMTIHGRTIDFAGISNKVSIAVFHDADSFLQTSRYLVLEPKLDAIKPPKAPPPSSFEPPQTFGSTAAVFRTYKRRNAKPRLLQKPSESVLRAHLKTACKTSLERMINNKISSLKKKRSHGKQSKRPELIAKDKSDLKKKLLGLRSLPRNTLDPMVEAFGGGGPLQTARTYLNTLLKEIDRPALWKATVNTHFDYIWDYMWKSTLARGGRAGDNEEDENDDDGDGDGDDEGDDDGYGDGDGDGDGDDDDDDKKDKIRTCTVTLKSIMRQEHLLPRSGQDGRTNFDEVVKLLETAQKNMTNVETELSVLAQMATIMIASGEGLHGCSSVILDLEKLLPSDYQLDPAAAHEVKVNGDIDKLQRQIEAYRESKTGSGKDIHHLLSRFHLQSLHKEKLSGTKHSRSKAEKNPHVKALSKAIGTPRCLKKSPQRVSSTINTHIRQYSTAVSNMWRGSLYNKALGYLLRILLRLHLAPAREARYKGRQKNFAQQKAIRSGQRRRHQRSLNKRTKWRIKRLSNELCTHLQKIDKGGGSIQRSRVVVSKLESLQQGMSETTGASEGPQSQDTSAGATALDDPKFALEDVGEELEDEDEETGDTATEPSRKRLQALQAITKTLLESPHIKSGVNENLVRECAFKKDDLTQKEIRTIIKITKRLRPFVPKRCLNKDRTGERAHTPHVATRAPIVLIANAVLRATGYSNFAQRLVPQVSGMSVHSLHLGTNTLYEALCSTEARRFDAVDSTGNTFKSPAQAMSSDANKQALYKAFFDMEKVDSICKAHGLVFANRMMFVDRYTVRMLGKVVGHNEGYTGDASGDRRQGYPVESQFDRRQKNRRGRPSEMPWTSEYRQGKKNKNQVDKKAEAASEAVKAKEVELQPLRKAVGKLQQSLTKLRRDGAELCALAPVRKELQDKRRALLPQEEKLRVLRRESYYWNKVAKAAESESSLGDGGSSGGGKNSSGGKKNSGGKKSSSGGNKSSSGGKSSQGGGHSGGSASQKMTTATWGRPTVEDRPQLMDISDLEEHAKRQDKHIVFAGTDYGICTMSETVALTRQEIETHIARYQSATKTSGSASTTPTTGVQNAQSLKLKRSYKMSARQVNEVSHAHKLAKHRERVLAQTRNTAAKRALDTISKPENSLITADSMEKISRAHMARSRVRDTLQAFESTNRMLKMKRTQRLRTERTWAKLCAAERRYVQQHALDSLPVTTDASISPINGWCNDCTCHHIPSNFDGSVPFQHVKECPSRRHVVQPILLIGDSGTGVGSRIKGHARRGGGKMRAQHIRHCTIGMTDEYRTSKTCVFCFHQVRLARHRRMVKGQEKLVNVNGAVECVNPDCVSVKSGYCQKPRDTHAAVAIAIAGAHQLFHKKAFEPFTRAFTRY
ncbi:hypothetical protein DFQ27_005639 [Actinomortierella ambigua]|uniref:Uncharacterized protein n=1 Tax=Actinomortierella ambigua TaxID=1343610 RepID=A0A9P6PZT2_9FUNG|nr:hypothetical protein DFQ27_005639 [Actinomortierella ambigua]